MAEAWALSETAAGGEAGGRVALVEGPAFLICSPGGEVSPGLVEGFYFRDTRFLSRWTLKVNGLALEALAQAVPDPYAATFIGRTQPGPGGADSTLLIERRRYVGRGMREDLIIRNFGDEPAYCAVEERFGVDFADLQAVKESRAPSGGYAAAQGRVGNGCEMVFSHSDGGRRRGLAISFSEPPTIDHDVARWEVIIASQGCWSVCQQFVCSIDGDDIEPRWLCGQPVTRAKPAERMAAWRRSVPVLDTDHEGLRAVVARSAEDLGALRIFDPDYPERTVVAAGAPWSMALFGRDSLLAAWMALIVDPELALGTLQTLARFQGSEVRPYNEEEPGRILHEMRFGEGPSIGGSLYYGSADATPLFVMLLGELRRWGLAREAVDELLPHADRAIEWMHKFGDRDGDGYVEYQRTSDRGLRNQGWKTSREAVRFADGRLAEPPIALAEVQGYTYGAYLARAFFAAEEGDAALASDLRARAAELKACFNRDFWLDDRGWLAMGLDRDKRPIDAMTSNMGHCLWTGILDADKAEAVAKRLVGPDLFTGWGVRTLAASMVGYNPISYHCGSVWPHDSAIAAAGLMRYGYVREAQRVVMAVLDAAVAQGGRLPELYSGLDRLEVPLVVPFPTSSSPQAWAAASPLLMLRTLLRLDPWVPRGKVWLQPALPPQIHRLHVGRIPLAGARVSVSVEDDAVSVEGLPDGLELVDAPRHPLTGS